MKKSRLRKIKKLAEKYFYCGKELTQKERFLVENSPFSNILRPNKKDTEFYKVLEQFEMESEVNVVDEQPSKPVRPYKKKYLHIVDRRYIGDLIDDLEEHFNLGVYNKSLYKYEGINIEDLKVYIDKHCRANLMDKAHPATCSHLTDIIENEDNVYDIMYKLYSLQR